MRLRRSGVTTPLFCTSALLLTLFPMLLSGACADRRAQPSEIVLTDGEWTTTIQPGHIVLSGPDGAYAVLTIRSDTTSNGRPVTHVEPRLDLVGPSKDATQAGPTATIGTDESGSMIALRGVRSHEESMVELPGLSDRSFSFIGLGVTRSNTSLRMTERGNLVLDLPTR